MSNPAADYPTSVHSSTDIGALANSYLGASNPTHTEVHGKLENEIVAVQTKVGTGASTPASGQFLKATGTGVSAWASLSLTDISAITATATELNYVDGVTSSIQTQLDGKVNDNGDTMTGGLNMSGATTQILFPDNSTTAGGLSFGGDITFARVNTGTLRFTAAAPILEATSTNNASGLRLNVTSAATTAFRFQYSGSALVTINPSGATLVSNGNTTVRTTNTIIPQFQVEGTDAAGSAVSITRNSADANPPAIYFGKSRSASNGGVTVTNSGDLLGTIAFMGADGSDTNSFGASITAAVDGTPGNNDMPGRLVFSTTADGAASVTERMRLDSSGQLGIGVTPTASNGYLQLPASTTLATGGIAWGTDTNLYRSAANQLQTNDALVVDSNLTVGTGSTSVGVGVRASSFNGLTVDVYSDTASAYNFFRRARGSFASPTFTTNNSFLGSFGFRGHDGSAFLNQDSARFSGFATQDVSGGTHGGALAFYTAANGTSTAVGSSERMRIENDGNVRIGSSATISSKLTFDAATTAAGGILFGADTNLYRSAADTLKTDDNLIVAAAGTAANSVASIDATQTLTNKRITKRVYAISGTTSPQTFNFDNYDEINMTAMSTDMTIANPTYTVPANGDEIVIRMKDNGTSRAITWGANFISSGIATLLAATSISKTHYVRLRYDSTAGKWVCLSSDAVGY